MRLPEHITLQEGEIYARAAILYALQSTVMRDRTRLEEWRLAPPAVTLFMMAYNNLMYRELPAHPDKL